MPHSYVNGTIPPPDEAEASRRNDSLGQAEMLVGPLREASGLGQFAHGKSALMTAEPLAHTTLGQLDVEILGRITCLSRVTLAPGRSFVW